MDGIEIKNKYYGGKIMIKYPLYVTLDTNIFDANKLDFGKESTLEYCYEDIVKALENIAELIEQDIKNEGNITKKIEKVITTE